MDGLIESAPGIIEQAAKSPLGILALMVLAISVLGVVFFRGASEKTRARMFVLMFVGVASFGYAIFRKVQPNGSDSPNTRSADGSSQPGTGGGGRVAADGGMAASTSPTKEVQGPLSIDRDTPTRLTSSTVRGTGVDRGRVQYFCSFSGGPGEVKVIFDFTSGGYDGSAHVNLFDEDFRRIDSMYLGGHKGDSRREVRRIPLSNQQRVILELDLESRSGAAGSFLLRVEGAVQF